MDPTSRAPRVLCRVLASVMVALCASAAAADVGVRLPAEATGEEAAAIRAAVERAQKAPVRVFTAPAAAPAPEAIPAAATEALGRARVAYQNLELDAARAALAEAEAACVAGGGCGACLELLFEAHLLAGAVAVSLGQDDVGAEEFVIAHAVQPHRVVDPRRFPPKIVGAFARACADLEKASPTAFRLASEPAGAALSLNGAPVASGTAIPARARRAYVEARLAGFAPRCEAVDASPAERVIRLQPLPAEREPAEAERLLALDAPALDAAAIAFLGRIGVDRFVAATPAAKPYRLALRAARAGAPTWIALPPLTAAADAASPELGSALAAALGEKPDAVAPPDPPPAPIPAEDPDGLDDEEEDDSVLLDPSAPPPPDDGAGTGAKLLRSPWLWISVGIVVAVVGGVVIGTQVNK